MNIRAKNTRTHFKHSAYILLCGTLLMTQLSFVMAASSEANQTRAGIKTQVHGEGKSPTNCDMENITIWHNGKTTSINSKELITFPAAGNVEASARRILKQGKPVLPVANFITDYPDTRNITFESCDSDDYFNVTKEEIEKNNKTFILTFNRTGRTRLVKLEEVGSRGRYQTVAKNIVSITLSQ